MVMNIIKSVYHGKCIISMHSKVVDKRKSVLVQIHMSVQIQPFFLFLLLKEYFSYYADYNKSNSRIFISLVYFNLTTNSNHLCTLYVKNKCKN